ncbi:nicotinate-nucleotide pyrophosphorylase [Denitrovibrio acetiphilus DSM 12809]|uniref:Probable nicotinate-nucleotide pyrophosphorylase [carboxylating] n=1 Tax=Denitrovibrio acetiphilus (strain DSM 12809 / NBRC 114555 / N2460) TaxID=522772 RepID=D4H0J4_DENA2|nr:carboxylating nicotinate-nucleotide diphosphorylase [Denitrovibrio acetiphilus]ADD68507.1 nicotinate-nucleotide pyrophosphorylase [Denitrovibrio acetiphilus DSM 12809]
MLRERLIQLALEEDIGTGDLTARAFRKQNKRGIFKYLAKDDFILCGTKSASLVFEELDEDINVRFYHEDGACLKKGEYFGEVEGPIYSILTGERTSLNFLQRLSGIATETASYVKELKGTNIRLLDTRKTTPGWRVAEKYAVLTGGGHNHRMGLFDGVMLKDNHIDAAGGIKEAVDLVKRNIPSTVKVEVEVRDHEEARQAAEYGADIIMLDNFAVEDIQKAIDIINKRAKIEISGGIRKENLKDYRNLDIDYISVGALTHHATSVDISLKIQKG